MLLQLPILITLTPDEMASLTKHAEDRYVKECDTGSGLREDYGWRARVNETLIGCMAEYAWCQLIGGRVDYSIWTGKVANNNPPDIVDDPDHPNRDAYRTFRLHVKACSAKHKGGQFDSWTAGRSDPLSSDPSAKDLILLAYSDPHTSTVELVGMVLADELTGLWQDCISKKMRHKQAIYRPSIGASVAPWVIY